MEELFMQHWMLGLPVAIMVGLWLLGQDWHEDAPAYRAALDAIDDD